MMTIDEAFNESISYYDDWMKKALPDYDGLFRTARELLPFLPDAAIDVLDLGAGTGLFSQHVLGWYPRARFLLVDVADRMLQVARERFRSNSDQFEFRVEDYRRFIPDRKFDLAISSLSIHHLEDEEKQNLFRVIFESLNTPGMFINIDQIRGKTEYLRELYWTNWLQRVRKCEPDERRIQESIGRRKTYDRDALLQDQWNWLEQAGFTDVDCVYKNYFLGVFFARKV